MKRFFLFAIIILALSSCVKNNFLNSPQVKLEFSTDTLYFDTVFTQVGSATRIFKVYNPYSQDVKIDRIFLARGENSPFRLNINGVPALELQDVIIPARDSIYIFADVTVEPNKGYLIELDSVVFDIAGSLQSVKLLAVGWEVHLLRRAIIDSDQTWTPDMPYLIFDYVFVDTNVRLTIEPGTKVFLHRGAVFYVAGSLTCNGLRDSMIVFASDRLEQDYQDIPGQWGGIVLSRTSTGNSFEFTEIRNSIVGVSIDSVTDTVKIYNSIVWHQSYASVYACCSNVRILGSLLADAGWYVAAFVKGGYYEMINNTIANYYGWGTIRQTPSVAVTNYAIVNDNPVFWQPVTLKVYNTIVYGSLEDEFVLSAATEWENFDYDLQNNLLKTKGDYVCQGCILNENPLFNDIEGFDFTLSENSPAIDAGNSVFVNLFQGVLQYDLNGTDRLSDAAPDIGVFEYSPDGQ